MKRKINIPNYPEKGLYSMTTEQPLKRQIIAEFSYTIDIGGKEWPKIHLGVIRDLGKEENIDQAIDREFEFVQSKVFDKIDELLDKKEN